MLAYLRCETLLSFAEGLVGLVLALIVLVPGSLLSWVSAVELVAPETVLRPELVVRRMLVGLVLSGVVGDTRPWMVLETRAETVTRFRSLEAGGFVVLSDFAGVTCELVPFCDV